MSERPPEEKALFERVIRMLDRSREQTPATLEDVAKLTDLGAALSLCVVLAADIDRITGGTGDAKYCGHCRVVDAALRAEKEHRREAVAPDELIAKPFATHEEAQAHIVQCPHNPLVRAVWTALNAIDAMSAAKLLGHVPEEFHIAHNVAIEALMRMVGR